MRKNTVQLGRRGKKALVGGVAVAALAAGGIGTAAPAGAATATTSHACDSLTVTSVQLVFDYSDAAPAGPSVGDSAKFHDNILDAAGNVIGTRDGSAYIAYTDPSTGHLMATYDATFALPGGNVESVGVIDTVAANAGRTTTITGIGTSGGYAGKTGTVSNTKTTATEDSVTIRLCG